MQPPAPSAAPPGMQPPAPGAFHPYAPPVAHGPYAPPVAHGQYPPHLPPPYYPAQNPVLASVELATPGVRLLAKIIDNVVLFAPFLLFALVKPLDLDDDGKAALAIVAFMLCLAVTGVQILLASRYGKSIGKKMLGLKMIRQDGSEVGFVHGWLIRSFVYGLIEGMGNMMFLWIPALVDSLMIFSDNHLTLHDRMASTYVIVDR